MTDALIALARVLVVVLFVVAGWGKLMNPAGITGTLASKGLPMPQVLAWLTIAAELGLGLLIAVGFYARTAAVLLAGFTVATIFTAHNFWAMTGAEALMNRTQALKNLSIIGALLLIAAVGAGRYAANRR